MKGSDIKALEYKNLGRHQLIDDETDIPLQGMKADVVVGYPYEVSPGTETSAVFSVTLDDSDIAGLSDNTRLELATLVETKLLALIGK